MLEGKTVEKVRPMTKRELKASGLEDFNRCTVIVFTDGTKLFALRDSEGNGPGIMIVDIGPKQFYL